MLRTRTNAGQSLSSALSARLHHQMHSQQAIVAACLDMEVGDVVEGKLAGCLKMGCHLGSALAACQHPLLHHLPLLYNSSTFLLIVCSW